VDGDVAVVLHTGSLFCYYQYSTSNGVLYVEGYEE